MKLTTYLVIVLGALIIPHAGISAEPVSQRLTLTYGNDRFDQVTMTIDQTGPARPKKPQTNRSYLQPRWLDGGYGVDVLQPGRWIEAKSSH